MGNGSEQARRRLQQKVEGLGIGAVLPARCTKAPLFHSYASACFGTKLPSAVPIHARTRISHHGARSFRWPDGSLGDTPPPPNPYAVVREAVLWHRAPWRVWEFGVWQGRAMDQGRAPHAACWTPPRTARALCDCHRPGAGAGLPWHCTVGRRAPTPASPRRGTPCATEWAFRTAHTSRV